MAYHGCHHLSCSSFRSLCYGHHVTAMAFPNRVGFDLTADELAFVDFLQTAHIPPELVRTISQGIQPTNQLGDCQNLVEQTGRSGDRQPEDDS